MNKHTIRAIGYLFVGIGSKWQPVRLYDLLVNRVFPA